MATMDASCLGTNIMYFLTALSVCVVIKYIFCAKVKCVYLVAVIYQHIKLLFQGFSC